MKVDSDDSMDSVCCITADAMETVVRQRPQRRVAERGAREDGGVGVASEGSRRQVPPASEESRPEGSSRSSAIQLQHIIASASADDLPDEIEGCTIATSVNMKVSWNTYSFCNTDVLEQFSLCFSTGT